MQKKVGVKFIDLLNDKFEEEKSNMNHLIIQPLIEEDIKFIINGNDICFYSISFNNDDFYCYDICLYEVEKYYEVKKFIKKYENYNFNVMRVYDDGNTLVETATLITLNTPDNIDDLEEEFEFDIWDEDDIETLKKLLEKEKMGS